MSKKVKLKSLHLFMSMILLIGLIQPGFVYAMDVANTEEETTEEIEASVEEKEPLEEEIEEIIEETEVPMESEEVEEADIPDVHTETTQEEEPAVEKESFEEENSNSNEEDLESSSLKKDDDETQLSESDTELFDNGDNLDEEVVVNEAYLTNNVINETNSAAELFLNMSHEASLTHINVYDMEGDLQGYLRDDSVNNATLQPGENHLSFTANYCPSFATPNDCLINNYDIPDGEYNLEIRIAVGSEYIENTIVGPLLVNTTVPEIEFGFELSPDRISQWDLARGGVDFELDAPVGKDVTVTIADYTFQFVSYWLYRDNYILDLSPGTYPFEVTIEETTVIETLEVVSNEEFWEDTTDPSAFTRTTVLTKSEAEEIETIRVEASDFPQHAYVDLAVNGNGIDTLYTDWGIYGSVTAFVDVTELPIGEHSIEFIHPTGTAATTLFIVPDEIGESVPPGTYTGLTNQHTGGSEELDTPFELPITFEVDEDGFLQNLKVEYWWVCVFGGGSSGFSTAEDITPTQITVNQPFQINWEEYGIEYSLAGIIHEDGTASGSFNNYLAACGYGVSDWDLTSDTAPEPQPEEFEVELDLDTTEETEDPVTISVTTTSDADIESLKWLAGERAEEDFANAGNEIDIETASFTVEENGTYTIYVSNANGVTALSMITISNIIDPGDTEIDFNFDLRTDNVSQWELARSGVDLAVFGPTDAEGTITIGEETIEFEVQYHTERTITAKLSPGMHPVTVTIGNQSKTQNLEVLSDDEYWEVTADPSLFTGRVHVLTESEAEELGVLRVDGADFHYPVSLDVLVNGSTVETIFASESDPHTEIDISNLPIGEHTIEFTHPTGSAMTTIHIIPDESGAPAAAGTFEGLTYQYMGGSTELDNPFELPIKFEVDEDGVLQNLEIEYWWVCVLGGGQSGFNTATELPPTQITVNQPFQIDWEHYGEYSFVGVINEDGTASGKFFVYSGGCGVHAADWNFVSEQAPEPQPEEFEVELDLDTTEETEGPVTITITTTSDAEIESLKWLAGERTEEDFSDAGNEIDLSAMSFTVAENGIYSIYALNADGVAALSTVTINNITNPDDGTDPGNDGDPGGDPDDSTDPDDGSDPGDDTGSDDGSDPGDDTDSGDGSDPGDDTDSGDDSDSGDDTDSGDDSDSGDDIDSGNNSDTSEDTALGEETDSDGNGKTLPSTATNMFNLLLIGGALFMLGLILILFKRKQNA